MATSGAELASSDPGAVTCDDAIDMPAASPPAATEPADVASRSLVELYDLSVQDCLMAGWGGAVRWFRSTQARSPDPATPFALGAAHAQGGRIDEAITEFTRFVETHPDHAPVRLARDAIDHLGAGQAFGARFDPLPANPCWSS